MAIATECISIGANSWLIDWVSDGREGKGEDGEDGFGLHFDGLYGYTRVYLEGKRKM